ncbi:MAG: recombination protein RecR [Erysipelotrichaceae bacterium]|nr:recombination protein RecR [Erysipelotrichaceae bacterium]MBQ9986846.1 recombination protein RecR [Erysipelotrichales bacterium]MBR3693089.1 recombination protein RecR [Erysipelotrichales bacterium]
MEYPKVFEDLINSFRKLPGVGAKTAERYAYQILDLKEEQVALFLESMEKAYHTLRPCSVCGNLTDQDRCMICEDSKRDTSLICVVTKAKDIIAIEKSGTYHGVYHVLDGEISTTKGILPENIRIKELLERITPDVKELILATNPTVDGETTALYIGKLLQNHDVIVTRLAHGLPMGGHLDYADELTLIKAMEGRKKI